MPSFEKRTYVNGETVITAENLNAIQDEIIANANNINGKEAKGKITIGNTEYTVRTSTTNAGAAGYITFVIS